MWRRVATQWEEGGGQRDAQFGIQMGWAGGWEQREVQLSWVCETSFYIRIVFVLGV